MEEIEQIYRKYTPQVYKFLFSLCHDKYLAEELTQETFFQAMKSIDKFLTPLPFQKQHSQTLFHLLRLAVTALMFFPVLFF